MSASSVHADDYMAKIYFRGECAEVILGCLLASQHSFKCLASYAVLIKSMFMLLAELPAKVHVVNTMFTLSCNVHYEKG